MLKPEELSAIRERAERATPGPWQPEGGQIARREAEQERSINDHMIVRDGGMWRENEIFIAYARADIPALLSHIAELEAQRSAGEPEGCTLVAHDTGDGWCLSVEDSQNNTVALLAWPKSWPESQSAKDLTDKGFLIV
nr:Ead/Ea22-like protein [uncultured bacterium]